MACHDAGQATPARPLGIWLPRNHEKRDGREARDADQDTDLSPIHPPTVLDIGSPLLWTKWSQDCLTRRVAVFSTTFTAVLLL
jgi:hypothetical protein